MTDKLNEPTFDTEGARRVLENEKQDRARRAERRINEVLQEERCGITGIVQVTPQGTLTASVAIVPQD